MSFLPLSAHETLSFPGHPAVLRAHPAARAQPRDDQPPVRPLHQGGRHGAQLHAEVQEEVRDHAAVQAHGGQEGVNVHLRAYLIYVEPKERR